MTNKQLFYKHLKCGLLTFGGGNAVIPILRSEFVERDALSNDDFTEIISICNLIPGPIMIQLAYGIGKKLSNTKGAIISGIAISIPSIIVFVVVMVTIGSLIDSEQLSVITAPIFVVLAISMLEVCLNVFKTIEHTKSKEVISIIIALVTFVLIFFLKVNPTLIIFIGILYTLLKVKYVN